MKPILNTGIVILFSFLMVSASLFGDNNDIPPRPSPPRLVNDFTGTLNRNEVNALERKLVRFNDTTSTQIVVVLINSLEGYDKAQFADLLGEKWGVGQKGKDNGIVVLVKPKVGNSKGQAFIASGYGLEGAVPDAVAKRIVDNEMIPEFMQNRYYAGLEKGTGTLMELTAGEYSADEYMKRSQNDSGWFSIVIFLFFIFIVVMRMIRRKGTMQQVGGRSGSSLPFWTALFLANQMGHGNSGKWNDFSSGSGGFGGGSSGGFGGFGGGSFGGGGAGGSW